MIEIQRAAAGTIWPAGGEWIRIRDSEIPRPTARVGCPTCGQSSALDHEIAADGTVTPSLVCARSGCKFHDHVKLVGWEP